ncbi:MAG: dihydrolipoyl dehydrogenase [Candidatus Omnitrophota bacterium]|nr:dihydrolipoyl dehydrogenase [Candidatus Omnitrophota bacterium]
MEDFDICIIGAGPGGTAAAVEASSLGARVAVIEKDEVGGICLNKGCIPTKAFLKSALLYEELKRSDEFGISCKDISYDLSHIKRRAKEVVNVLKGQLGSSLKARKIDFIKGKAAFVDNKHIVVGEKKINARSFIVATGSSPKGLDSLAVDNKRIFCSEGILEIEKMPKDITIIGAGAIGCEFASFFSAFGVKVTLVEMLESILPNEDRDISSRLEGIFKKKGIEVLTGDSSLNTRTIKSEVILISVGRSANVKDIGLENAGVIVKDGRLSVNEYLETDSPGIFAIGDCIGKYNLAHMASAQGRVAARNALGGKTAMDYTIVPMCVYSIPEVASVGLNAIEAENKGYELRSSRLHFAGLGRAQTEGAAEGFIKLVADKKSGAVLGAQILGHYASELIGLVSIAIRRRLKIEDVAEITQAHPTFCEGIQEAALNLSRQVR